MKRLISISIGLLLSIYGFSQSCLPEGIFFYSQTEIDSFQYNYPNCTAIEGDVTIFGSNYTEIRNLNGLIVVSTIGGNLSIYLNLALGSLIGLEGLTSIGGDLKINENETLTSLTGLGNITSIGGSVHIEYNSALASLMEKNNLTSIEGELTIHHNTSLSSLIGLNNINAGSITDLDISENSSLSNCTVQSICDYLASPNGIIYIHGNDTGCNSQEEVETACGVGFEELGTLENLINIYPNPSSTQFTIESKIPINQGIIDIFSMTGHKPNHFQINKPKMDVNISYLPAGVYFVRLTYENEVRMFKVVKY